MKKSLPMLGKLAPRHDVRTLKLARYLDLSALPTAPPTLKLSAAVDKYDMDGNDTYGDCTIAGVHHLIQTQRANAQLPVKAITAQQVVAQYLKLSGGKDTGLVLLDVLKAWKNSGLLGGDKIGAFASVNVHNPDELKAAASLFGGLYTGIELPIAWQGAKQWTLPKNLRGRNAPGSWGGHCVDGLDYDAGFFYFCTWGMMIPTTPGAIGAYVSEMYVIISANWIKNTGLAPSGVDMAGLKADLAKL